MMVSIVLNLIGKIQKSGLPADQADPFHFRWNNAIHELYNSDVCHIQLIRF